MRPEYKKEYIDLWESCKINDSIKTNLDKLVYNILEYKRNYSLVSMAVDLPWYLVACIHSLEASLNFKTHLHNGDPLSARTIQVPSGRPKKKDPPFSWEFSAADALLEKINGIWNEDIAEIKKGNIDAILYALESYNGLGYKKYHPDIKTPYLWSKTNIYIKGKYVKDGKFDSNAISDQIGAVPILKILEGRKSIDPFLISNLYEIKNPIISLKSDVKTIARLQIFMNNLEGEKIGEDGKIGPKTNKRFKEVFGFSLM